MDVKSSWPDGPGPADGRGAGSAWWGLSSLIKIQPRSDISHHRVLLSTQKYRRYIFWACPTSSEFLPLLTEYFADEGPESRCQMFHVCVGSSPQAFFSFLCPNGTLFHQELSTCDWWFNVDCEPSVRIDTIYSALSRANEKYEIQRSRNLEPSLRTGRARLWREADIRL